MLENNFAVSEIKGYFKPRQVLLSNHSMKQTNDTQTPKSADEGASLHPQHKTLLLHAVAFFLERNGFSKTLKKFRSEAQIENCSSKNLLISLEDMFHKHLKKCSQAITTQDKPDEEMAKEVVDERIPEAQEETTKKSKDKKKIKKNAVAETHPDAAEKEKSEPVHVESMKNGNGTTAHEEAGKKSKDKKKKKNKEKLETVSIVADDVAVNSGLNVEVAPLEEKVVKSKTKKKKDGRHLSDENSKQLNDTTEMLLEEEHNENSKKRKRLASEDNDICTVDEKEKETEDVKRRKLEGSNGCNDGSRSTTIELSQQTNDVEKTVEKTSTKKALKKHSNGSAEPKTINAFQRVKVDAVTFADDKLADNSYWAKGGAETGYGAKAQEVLGQVKGRDFRHEKTKKKRGSYRGGVIDLQSHSVKFNYSDDD